MPLSGKVIKTDVIQSILGSMADAVVVVDLSGHILLINPRAQRLLKMKPVAEAPYQTFLDYELLQPDGKTAYAPGDRPMQRALRGEQVDSLIALVHHGAAADETWVSINARPIHDERGACIGGVASFHDITELRHREIDMAQQASLLREQAALLQEHARLLDITLDAVLVRDCADVITYWNHSAENLYGYAKREAIGRCGRDLLDTTFPIPEEDILAIMQSTHHWEGELVHRTKSGRRITVFSQWVLDKRTCRYLEINTDITQRLQTERALQQVQENYRLLVETSTDYAMIVTDPDGVIVHWNAGAEKILGLPAAQALGQPVLRTLAPEDKSTGQASHELQLARKNGRVEDKHWHVRKDGTRFWASGVTVPLWNDDGSLRGYTKILRDETAHRLAEEKTLFLANHDMLTGLPNRVSFSNQLHMSIARTDRSGYPLAVLLLDLDRFKYVNDTFGHHAGDLLLKEVSLRIRATLRETDFVARLGGDEFVVIQTDVIQPQAAETLARKLVAELGRPYRLEQDEIISGTSIGIAAYPTDAGNMVELLKNADLALYRAKSKGRGTFRFYTADLQVEKSSRQDREYGLRNALQNREFALHYQPQIDLNTWTITSVEALLRWRASEMDLVLPDEFLGLAEETGLIVEIGKWALQEACRQVMQWRQQGMPELRISINCSARQFGDPEFVKMIGPILADAGLAPDSLVLEISESMLVRPQMKDQLAALKALGVRITVDNFGTGATTLIDLRNFEVDSLKIDKAFVQHVPHRYRDAAITSAIINLAHELGIDVSAGGVETAEQLAYLKSKDCNSAQGFIFSPPVPAVEFEEQMLSGYWSRIGGMTALRDGLH